MTTPRILVTVSRSWTAWSTMRDALTQCHDRHPDAVLRWAGMRRNAGIPTFRYLQGQS